MNYEREGIAPKRREERNAFPLAPSEPTLLTVRLRPRSYVAAPRIPEIDLADQIGLDVSVSVNVIARNTPTLHLPRQRLLRHAKAQTTARYIRSEN